MFLFFNFNSSKNYLVLETLVDDTSLILNLNIVISTLDV